MSQKQGRGSLEEDVYERDGYECRSCGARGGHRGDAELRAHHVVPEALGGPDERSNLVTLCVDCHDKVRAHEDGNGREQMDSDPDPGMRCTDLSSRPEIADFGDADRE